MKSNDFKNLEFKYNFYFNMYKDKELPNSNAFRLKFKKKHGNFVLLNELVKDITNYQVKKYGSTIISSNIIRRFQKYDKYKKSKKIRYI